MSDVIASDHHVCVVASRCVNTVRLLLDLLELLLILIVDFLQFLCAASDPALMAFFCQIIFIVFCQLALNKETPLFVCSKTAI